MSWSNVVPSVIMETSAAAALAALYGESFYGEGVADFLTGEMEDLRPSPLDSTTTFYC